MAEALRQIAAKGPSALSLRAVAAAVGVSNAAPVHHFGDKAGLLTAIAAEGFETLAATLAGAWEEGGTLLEVGVAYVGFATTHQAHFQVMYRPDLYRSQDPEVRTARNAAAAVLYGAASTVEGVTGDDTLQVGVAGWALMHGIAELWRCGNLPRALGRDPEAIARELGTYLFPSGRPRP